MDSRRNSEIGSSVVDKVEKRLARSVEVFPEQEGAAQSYPMTAPLGTTTKPVSDIVQPCSLSACGS
jgi:hypothetical protein